MRTTYAPCAIKPTLWVRLQFLALFGDDSLLSPRVNYNVHDEGGVLRFDQMAAALKAAGRDIQALIAETGCPSLGLPFLWIYGRRDFTLSVIGANIYPEDLE